MMNSRVFLNQVETFSTDPKTTETISGEFEIVGELEEYNIIMVQDVDTLDVYYISSNALTNEPTMSEKIEKLAKMTLGGIRRGHDVERLISTLFLASTYETTATFKMVKILVWKAVKKLDYNAYRTLFPTVTIETI